MTSLTPPSDDVRRWRERHAGMATDWRAVIAVEHARDAASVGQWTSRLAQIQATQRHLVRTGQWRGGPRTMLAALDLQYKELAMTAGFAWLLRPDGHHGLGSAVLSNLLAYLGLEGAGAWPGLRIVLEEQRLETRADLVVYGPAWTIVVEAKTFAVEQDRQLDRLYDNWRQETNPHFVFLTRGPRVPTTAVDSHEQWRGLTWQQVAAMASEPASSMAGVAPGVHDYLATLEAYHRV